MADDKFNLEEERIKAKLVAEELLKMVYNEVGKSVVKGILWMFVLGLIVVSVWMGKIPTPWS